jgi:SNF2 family DNA or RNA helicase
MDPQVFEAWTRTPQNDPTAPTMNGFMHVDRIIRLQDYVIRRPLVTENILVEEGRRISEEDRELRRLFIEGQKRKGKRNKKALSIQDDHASGLADNATKKARAPDTLKEIQKELSASITRIDGEPTTHDKAFPSSATSRESDPEPSSGHSEILSASPFANIRVGHSVSSKINWIINEVKSYSATEKFLIFSDSELSLAHVAEALELIQVKFLRFTTQIEPRYREQLVLTFETSELYRVFLMELKHGARGL